MSKTVPSSPLPAWGVVRTLAIVATAFAAGALALLMLDDRRREAAQEAIVLTLSDACPDPKSSFFVRAFNTSSWTAIDIEFVVEAHLPGRDGNLAPRHLYRMDDTVPPGKSAGRCWPYPSLADATATSHDPTKLRWRVVRTSVTFIH